MNGNTVLCFSCEPGGAEVLIPVIRLLEARKGCRVVVLGYGLGAARFAAKGVEYTEIEPVQKNDPTAIERFCPDLIITSATSLPERDMSEKHLWHNARGQGVATLAFIDQWQNYSQRFSGAMGKERLAYLPDYINCIDEVGEAEMVMEGFPRERLVKLGHPYLSGLMEANAAVDPEEVRRRLGLPPGEMVPLFVSEAIREHYGRSRGYDQYDAFRIFLELCSTQGKRRPLVKVHPKDSVAGYRELSAGYVDLDPFFVQSDLAPGQCLAIADRVYGMTSILLIEAYVLGKEVVSLQPGLRIEDPLMLSRHGLVKRIGAAEEATGRFKPRRSTFSYDFDEENFVAALEKLFSLRLERP